MTRREFLAAVAAAAALGRATAAASPLGLPFGFQAWEIAPDMRKDWDGTLKAMKDYGYSYADLNQVPPFTERSAADLKASFVSHGFTFTNALWPYQAFASRFDQTVADSQTLGLKTIVCSPRPRLRTTDDWTTFADELNKYGERTKAAGLQLGYHNHEIEFVKTAQGDAPWDVLVQATDPSLVQFLLDVGNCAFGGGDPYAYLDKYKARYYGVHVKDLKPGKAAVPVGAGDLDWTRIFTLVKAAGISNIVAEVGAYGAATLQGQPLAPPDYSVLELYKRSADYLKAFSAV
ncbi:MAG: sugar phosphate isomerase/epimerase [Vicinamibacterales bacterium]